jgi:anti-sigma regulatory factor (Ser/Thr protein kinase)
MPGPGTQATRSDALTPTEPAPEDDSPHASPHARTLTLPGRADQVLKARSFIDRTLGARGLDGEIACLLGSELVTNSVQHSDSRFPGGCVTVTVRAMPGEVLVEVTDEGGGELPELGDGANPCAEDGRGLLLVAALSARWGYQRGPGQLTTWFQVPAEPARPSLTPAKQDHPMPIHTPEPEAGTFRASDGRHADLFDVRHYPVHAICQLCGQPIEADNFLRPFVHVPEQAVAGRFS